MVVIADVSVFELGKTKKASNKMMRMANAISQCFLFMVKIMFYWCEQAQLNKNYAFNSVT